MNKIPLKYHKRVLFYTKYTHPTLICRGTDGRTHGRTDGRKIFTQYSGISSCSQGSTDSFNDNDAILFSQALKRNTHLRILGLERNNFTSTGVKALFSSLYDSSSLNAISESNHTCELDLFDNKKSAPFQQMLENLDRTSKILIALHEKEITTQIPRRCASGIDARCDGIHPGEGVGSNPINEYDVCSNEMVEYALTLLLSSL